MSMDGLAAIRARLEERVRSGEALAATFPEEGRRAADLRAILAAYDVAEDRAKQSHLNALEYDRLWTEARHRAEAAEAERDAAREHIKLLEEVTRSDETLNRLQAFNTQLQRANASLIQARHAAERERDDALIVVRNAQDYISGKYTLEPLRTLRDAVRDWEAKHVGAAGEGRR